MSRVHKQVQAAVLAVLADETAGFNRQLATALEEYGITEAISLSWSDRTKVTVGPAGSTDLESSYLTGRLVLRISPDGSQWSGETLGIKWSGRVFLRLVFDLNYACSRTDDIPLAADQVIAIAMAIEDTVIDVFQQRPTPAPLLGAEEGDYPGVVYAQPPDCPEGYQVTDEPDGTSVRIPIRIGFKVDATY